MKKIILAGLASASLLLTGCSTQSAEPVDEKQDVEEPLVEETEATNEDMGVFKLGQAQEYPDGLSATVEISGTDVSSDVFEGGGQTCYVVDFTIKNGTKAPFDGSMVMPGTVSYTTNGETVVADPEYLDTEIVEIFPRIMPGNEATASSCVIIPEEGLEEIYIDFSPDDMSTDTFREPLYWYGDTSDLL